MTSLRQQLATIHAKSTNELDLKAQKAAYAKSLLFEPKVAANQSLDLIYQLCYEGFEELCALDSRFMLFEKSIFSQQSKTEDRLQMTQRENKELDAVLDSFLGLVGARLLLKPAIKAVEWLIRRFRVLESNTETLVLTFLPYHATPIFTTLLSILPKQLPPSLKFLHPYIAQLSNPPRRVIVFTATQNTGFFAILNRYVLNVARAQHTYHVLLSFWASIVAQTINDMLKTSSSGRQTIQKQREDDLLTRILPILDEALAVRNVPELTLGCYMLIAVLVSRTSLDDRTLDGFMFAVGKSLTTDTAEAALGCLAIAAERRQGVRLPDKLMKIIMKIHNLAERMEELSAQQPIQRLTMSVIYGLLSSMSEVARPQELHILQKLFSSSILDRSQRDFFQQQIVKITDNHHGTTNGSAHGEYTLSGLLLLLEDREESSPGQSELIVDQMNIDKSVDGDIALAADTLPAAMSAIKSIQQASYVMELSQASLISNTIHTFEKLLAVFEEALPLKSTLDEFLSQSFFQQSNKNGDVTFFSFFMRVWVTSRSKLARIRALQVVIKRTAESQLNLNDLQAMIPYVLQALGDLSVDVRRQGAELVTEIGRQLMLDSSHDSKDDGWAQKINGSLAEEIKWMSRKTAGTFVSKVLLAGLEECISDASQVRRILQDGLGGSSHSKDELIEPHRARLKSTQRTEVFGFLCDEAKSTPLFSVKLRLLSLLNLVDKVGGHPRSKFLLPCAQQIVAMEGTELASVLSQEHIEISELDAQILEVVHSDDSEAMEFLLKLTGIRGSASRRGLQSTAFKRLRKLWPYLKRSKQKRITDDLLEASLERTSSSSSSSSHEESLETLRSVDIPVEVLVGLVDDAVRLLSQHEPPPASKKRRTSTGESVVMSGAAEENSKHHVGRLTLVLELIDGSQTQPNLSLFYSMFEALRILQHHRLHTTSDLGYLQNLVLSSMSDIIKRFGQSAQQPKVDESLIRVDLLVDCVRNTTSVQARNLALLLLAELTTYTPKAVLDSIMPIFTLMSATTMQQSDEFSAHVVDQTIQQVVPLLSQTLREQKQDLAAATAEILLSFAAAFEHIAPHRRLLLYAKLASSLGASESLFAVLATLYDRFPGNMEVDRFSVNLFRQFTSRECLATITRYLNLVLDCMEPKPTLSRILLRDDHGRGQQNSSLVILVSSMLNLLKDSVFRTKLAQDMTSESEASELRNSFSVAIEQTIRLSLVTSQKELSRTLCTQLLETMLSLLPLDQLAQSVAPLLDHTDQDVTRSILKTLEVRIKSSRNVNSAAKVATTRLLPRLTQMLGDEARASLKSNVLACVDQICGKFGKTDTSATFKAVEVISSEHCVGSSDQVLRVLSLHCLASSVEILQNDFIPLLQKSVPAAISSLQASLHGSTSSVKLHNAAYAFLATLVDHVPFMISRASLRAILEASHSSAITHLDQNAQESRMQFLRLSATRLDINSVVEVSGGALANALQQGPQALQEHIEMLKAAVENHSKAVIGRNSRMLFEVLFKILDLRRACTDDATKQMYRAQQVESLEASAISLVVSVVLKINDTIFRPFFSQMMEWSSSALPKQELVWKALRSTTVFNLITALSERLKAIFAPYFAYVLDRAQEVLKTEKSNDVASQALKVSVMRALSSSFKYDQDDFWQAPAHFDIILEPLIAQLSMQTPAQVTSDVIPAITEFAAAAASNDHHKDLNRLLLKTLKADSARVRLAAVKCQESLARRLGDEWLGHLPEMLPVINELQDDDDEGVERETHRWIKLIEETLGESLNSMLQ